MTTMNNIHAHTLLIEDHRNVEDLYKTFLQSDNKEELGDQILTALTVHAAIEEELYYPALQEAGMETNIDEFKKEHNQIKQHITQLHMMSADEEAYQERMQEMMEEVIHHVQEEENEAMPNVEELLSSEKLEEIGTRMQERKHELESSGLKRLIATAKSIVT